MFKSRDIRGRRFCLAVALVVVLVSGLAACSSPPASTPVPTAPPAQPTAVLPVDATTAQTVTIEMVDMAYKPKSVKIKAGTTVTWISKDAVSHSTTSDTHLWDSGFVQNGDTFSYTFTEPGTYKYHSAASLGITGEITVVR